ELGERRAGTADVMAGAETPTVGLHDHDLDRVVGLGVVQAVLDVPHHRRVLGVGPLRPVEDEPGDRPVLLVDDGFEFSAFHGPSRGAGHADTRQPPAEHPGRRDYGGVVAALVDVGLFHRLGIGLRGDGDAPARWFAETVGAELVRTGPEPGDTHWT